MLTDFFFSSGAWAAAASGELTAVLTAASIPPSFPFSLNASDAMLRGAVSGLGDYAGAGINLTVALTAAPLLNVSGADGLLVSDDYFYLNLTFVVDVAANGYAPIAHTQCGALLLALATAVFCCSNLVPRTRSNVCLASSLFCRTRPFWQLVIPFKIDASVSLGDFVPSASVNASLGLSHLHFGTVKVSASSGVGNVTASTFQTLFVVAGTGWGAVCVLVGSWGIYRQG